MPTGPLSCINYAVYGDFGAEQQGKRLVVLKPFTGWAERVHEHNGICCAEAPDFNNSRPGAVDKLLPGRNYSE